MKCLNLSPLELKKNRNYTGSIFFNEIAPKRLVVKVLSLGVYLLIEYTSFLGINFIKAPEKLFIDNLVSFAPVRLSFNYIDFFSMKESRLQ